MTGLVFALSRGTAVPATCPSVGAHGPLLILVASQGTWIGVGAQALLPGGGMGRCPVEGTSRFLCAWLHQFPVASVMNDHKQWLKQYTVITLQFRRSQVQIPGVDRAGFF